MAKQDFLVELGTEELPPKALKPLSDAFTRGITNGLEEAGIRFGKVEAFAAHAGLPSGYGTWKTLSRTNRWKNAARP